MFTFILIFVINCSAAEIRNEEIIENKEEKIVPKSNDNLDIPKPLEEEADLLIKAKSLDQEINISNERKESQGIKKNRKISLTDENQKIKKNTIKVKNLLRNEL